MISELTQRPETDPTQLYRYRDGLYAQDMLIVGIAWLDLFSWLARRPSDQAGIMQQFNTKERPTDVMLTLFTAMGLLAKQDQIFHITPLAREHLCADSPWFLGPYYDSLKERPVCHDLLKVLRTDKPANWGSQASGADWHIAMETESFANHFTAAMDCRGVYLAQALAGKIDLNGRNRLLDVAGGSGIYACSLCAHFTSLRATVLEKSPVDRVCERAIKRRGFSDKVTVLASDILTRPLPEGFDVHLWSNVLHDWDGETVKLLLKKSLDALPPGGSLIVHDAHLNADKTGPLHVAEYSVMLMHSTAGRCYSAKEITSYLEDAGFLDTKLIPTAAARSVIVARKGS